MNTRDKILTVAAMLAMAVIGFLAGHEVGRENTPIITRTVSNTRLFNWPAECEKEDNTFGMFGTNWFWNSGYREGYMDGYFALKNDKPLGEPLEWFEVFNFKDVREEGE